MSDSTTADIRATANATGNHGGESSVAAAHPVAVKGGATLSVSVLLLTLLVASVAVFLMSSSSPPHGAGEGGIKQQQRVGEPVEHAVGGDVGIPGFNSRLDAFRTWARLTWMKLRQPRSDEPRYDDSATSTVAGAAKKSFEMGKDTVEKAAATAGKATRETVGKATRTVGKATRETVGKAKEKAERAAVAADDDEEL